jgi:anthranilate synthase component 1
MQSRNILLINSKEGEGFSNLPMRIKHNVRWQKHCFAATCVSIGFIKTLYTSRRRIRISRITQHKPFTLLVLLIMEISKFLVIARSSNYCKDRKAEIHPIAGTLKEQVMMKKDAVLAKQLSEDKRKIVNMLVS